ncbi:hypothetical protein BC829DRAFT_445338 [Chytridium lagenaria]|nr:hypothetical protein BC829DRAFT_445338 [Chytridium lagenaria]
MPSSLSSGSNKHQSGAMEDNPHFILESTTPFSVLPSPLSLRVYKHRTTSLRVILAPIPRPPLVCGSEEYKERGFLDTLATRCLSSGSNAYTAEDHTAYTITTAGGEGMMEVMPRFTMSMDRMAGRENTEADLMDLTLRRLLYDNTPTRLNVVAAPRSFAPLPMMRFANTTEANTVLTASRSFSAASSTPLKLSAVSPNPIRFIALEKIPSQSPPLTDVKSETIEFPSSDETVGSIAYGWRGPPSEEVEEVMALEVLLRYLQNNAASPLNQAFVERADPWASSVDFDVKTFVTTGIVLYFSGVPYKEEEEEEDEDAMSDDGDVEWEDEEGDEDEDDDDEEFSDEDDEDEGERPVSRNTDASVPSSPKDLFTPNVFRNHLMLVLRTVSDNGIPASELRMTIRRLRRKILEAGEEDPHELALGYLLPDILRHHLSFTSKLNDTRHTGSSPILGLAEAKWLVEAPFVEVMAVPSGKLAKEIAEMEERGVKERKEELGEQGLEECRRAVAEAVEKNQVKLSKESLAKLPGVKDVSTLEKVRRRIRDGVLVKGEKGKREIRFRGNANEGNDTITEETEDAVGMRPFSSFVIVETDTAFSALRFGLHSGDLDPKLRPYLVLFQELIFESPLSIPNGTDTITVDYTDVVKRTFEAFVSFEASFGFGNDLWSATWLSDVFMLAASFEPEFMFGPGDLLPGAIGGTVLQGENKETEGGTVLLLVQALLFTQFTKERIHSAIRKLLSDLTETKRDGSSMLSAVGTRIMATTSGVGVSNAHIGKNAEGVETNDVAMSVFRQEKFLRELLVKCKDSQKVGEIFDALEAVREAVVKGGKRAGPGFLQLAVPLDEGGVDRGTVTLDKVVEIWDRQVEIYEMKAKGMKAGMGMGAFGMEMVDKKYLGGLAVPISGITASYLSVTVPCDVMRSKDYFAGESRDISPSFYLLPALTALLNFHSLFVSRPSFPHGRSLYTSIRGRGLAYDATMHLAIWTGQLSFEVHESTDPHAALVEMQRILLQLADDSNNGGFSQLAAPENIETARASVAYRIVEGRSYARGVVVSGLRSLLRGFGSLDEEEEGDADLYKVTAEDLKVAFWKYFWQFMDPARRVVVLVTPEGDGVAPLIDSFAKDPELKVPQRVVERRAVYVPTMKLQRVSLKDLAV